MTRVALAAGMVIQGRYELRQLLGQGGMGSVWVAWHRGLGVDVAIKFIDAPEANQQDLLARFTREAGAVARIKSPHVVSVMDHGYDEFHGVPFLAMELLAGESLMSRIERQQRISVSDTSDIVRQALRGLAKAHEAQIVHRDIKPDNIFICQDDELLVKILDFGIAKANFGDSTSHQTGTGALLGTPAYMSPEQALGNRGVDHRSDLYSMGVVAFHCLAGRPPFESTGLGELLLMIHSYPVPSLRGLRPDITPALDAWFQRVLAKSPSDRFQSAREMSQALQAACTHGGETSGRLSVLGTDQHQALSAQQLDRLGAAGFMPPASNFVPSGGTLSMDDKTRVMPPYAARQQSSPETTLRVEQAPAHMPALDEGAAFPAAPVPATLAGSSVTPLVPARNRGPRVWGGLVAAVVGVCSLGGLALSSRSSSSETNRLGSGSPSTAVVSATASAPVSAPPVVSAPAVSAPAPAVSAPAPVTTGNAVDINSLPSSPADPPSRGTGGSSVGKKSGRGDATSSGPPPEPKKDTPLTKAPKKDAQWD